MKDGLEVNEASLLERVRRAEEVAHEATVVAAVYRQRIKEAVELAKRAARERHPDFIYGALSSVELALDEENVKDWAKSWNEAWGADIRWLKRAIFEMRKVQAAAHRLDTTASSTNAEIQRIILTAARSVLVQHLPASVN
ncbi:MAG TPA: hypothetical protein VGA87_00895, partial [Pyrinomonadaceae bacterium]